MQTLSTIQDLLQRVRATLNQRSVAAPRAVPQSRSILDDIYVTESRLRAQIDGMTHERINWITGCITYAPRKMSADFQPIGQTARPSYIVVNRI